MLETTRCRLYPLQNADEVIHLFTDAAIREYLGGALAWDTAECNVQGKLENPRYQGFVVHRKSDHACIGLIELEEYPVSDVLELSYQYQCLSAAERGGNLSELFAIPAREKIGRAKGVPADQYKDAYANLLVEMEEQIAAIAEKGEKEE